MTAADWRRLIREAAALGVKTVQFFGGEPTLYPHLAELVGLALDLGLTVEVYTNLVHLDAAAQGGVLRPGLSLATSLYTDDEGEHERITGRPTLPRR